MKHFFLVVIVFSLAMISCKNHDEFVEDNNLNILAQNPNNQFDGVGILHNELLADIMKKANKKTRSGENMPFLELAQEELGLDYELVADIEEMITVENYKNDFRESILKHVTDNETQKVLINLFEKIRTENENGSYSSYENFKNEIELIENEVLSNLKLSYSPKEIILSTTSTLRHSAAFWNQYLAENSTIETRAKLKWWQWVIFAVADAAGGLVGGGGFSAAAVTGASTLAYTVMK